MKTALLILLVVWGIPSTFFRSRFRKIVYQTDDWKINIKPLFIKEIRGILSNIYPENKEYVRARNNYRAYLIVLFLQINFNRIFIGF